MTVTGLTSLVAEGKAQVRPSYHEIAAVGITLLISALGYIWGMYTTPHNFTRSGELIIITGILFAGLDLSGRLSLVDAWVVVQLERLRPAVLPGWDRKDRMQALAKIERRGLLEDHATSGVKAATDGARTRLRSIEVAILILGSLVCGFGDLIVVHR